MWGSFRVVQLVSLLLIHGAQEEGCRHDGSHGPALVAVIEGLPSNLLPGQGLVLTRTGHQDA